MGRSSSWECRAAQSHASREARGAPVGFTVHEVLFWFYGFYRLYRVTVRLYSFIMPLWRYEY
eukprot:scaffold40662_cov69-Phaeocystis_antarctica.AAC.2